MLYSMIEHRYTSALVLDPHDEYYGRNGLGLKDHPMSDENLVYYSPDPPRGGITLKVNIRHVKPSHVLEVMPQASDAQREACWTFYRHFREGWIERLFNVDETEAQELNVHFSSVQVLRRRLAITLQLRDADGAVFDRGDVFTTSGGEATVKDISTALEEGKKVIMDTSRLTEDAGLLIGAMVAREVFERYQKFKASGVLEEKPVVTFVIEEAPRVLGGEGGGIFKTIAREGRKFRVGITAITQLCSMIPRQILANMNTKIILGNEMKEERNAIISSASQDLSQESRIIAGLDRGEAIVSSVFTRFAIPIKIPLFEEIVKPAGKKEVPRFIG
ncbi:MAG: hypothetical protein DRJ64_08785 [Thermoprotei archaeon]|nr:MAG: hypothetical protein DRJ64_08785 [Thermoprotei archaeon]